MEFIKISSKYSQTWGLDLIIAVFIFSIGILVFLIYSMNYSMEAVNIFEKLSYDGESILKNLLSEGTPEDWNETNLIRIGLTSNNKINNTKLERFYNLTQTNYGLTKIIFNTKYDYYLIFDEKMIINSSEIEGIGKPGTTLKNINASNLIKITRFSIYKEKPTTIYLYVWE